jgi:hypothetical protein
MKDSFDMVTDVRSLINVPAITSVLGEGKIYPHRRPAGRSEKMDIVVNALGVNNAQYQTGTANINIYAPSIKATQEDSSVQYLPDYVKLNGLVKMVLPLVDSQYKPTFNTEVTDPGTLLQDADGNWFMSLQLAYRSIQDNNNI